jgi:hypothetical protein
VSRASTKETGAVCGLFSLRQIFFDEPKRQLRQSAPWALANSRQAPAQPGSSNRQQKRAIYSQNRE